MKKGVLILAFVLILYLGIISANCELRRFDWEPATVVEGTAATINIGVIGDSCQGKVFSLTVKEDDHGSSDDSVTNNPASITIGSNSPNSNTWVTATGTWNAEWQNDTDDYGETNPPEYYLTGIFDGQTYSSKDYFFTSPYLNVTKHIENNQDSEDQNYSHFNTSIKLPATCSSLEIKKTWDSVFKENSSGVNVVALNLSDYNLSASDFDICPVFLSYKIIENKVYYLEGLTFNFFGVNVTSITGSKINASQELIDSLESGDSDLLGSGNFESLIGKRETPINISGASEEFESVFKETSGEWEENESEIYNDTAYSFTKIDNSTDIAFSLSGSLLKQKDLGIVVYFWLGVPDINFTNYGEAVEKLRMQANTSINQSIQKLREIEGEIRTFPTTYQQDLANTIGVASLDNQINNLSMQLENATTSQEYLNIIQSTSQLRIPSKITLPTVANSFKIFPDKKNINLDALQNAGAGSYEQNRADEYKNAISSWGQSHVDITVNYKELGAVYYDGEDSILRVFELAVNPMGFNEEYYIVVQNLENLHFGGQYGQKQSGNYQYVTFTNQQARIVFTTTADVDFFSLPVFVSPGFSQLDLREPAPPEKKKLSKWWLYIIVLVILIIVGLIVYFLLKRWYERRYEDYLFKNKNHLFNLVTYINNMKNQGAKDEEIVRNLKKSGWHGEQIRYGMLKYAGKNTGMPRIPLLSFKKENIPIPKPAPQPIGPAPRRIPKKYRGV